MKKIILLLSIISFTRLEAQITINNSHMPVSGDTLRFTVALPDSAVLLNFQNTGANLNWDFSKLIPQRQGVRSFLSSAQTPYSSAVRNRIGEKLADTLSIGGFSLFNVYDFFNASTSDFSLDFRGASVPTGLPFIPTLNLTPSFSDKDEIYQFPLNYLDRDSSTFNVTFSNQLVGIFYQSSGFRINHVDAWGTIITPYDTFNAIKVVTDVVSFDSVNFANNGFGINQHVREYKWMTTSLRIPAFTVTGNVVAGVFIPTNVLYRDSVRNVPSLFAPIALFNANQTSVNIFDTVTINNLSISALAANFQWSISPNTFNFVNGTSATSNDVTVLFTDTGFYDVQLIAINSSGRDTLLLNDYIRVNLLTSINELENEIAKKIILSPNPTASSQFFTVENTSNAKINRILIVDITGKKILSQHILQNPKSFSVQAPLSPGVYLVQLETNLGFSIKKLLVH